MKAFTLDAKGKSKIDNGNSTLTLSKPTHGQLKFSLILKRGSFASALAAAGLTNQDIKSKPVAIAIKIALIDRTYASSIALTYSAKLGNSGSAK